VGFTHGGCHWFAQSSPHMLHNSKERSAIQQLYNQESPFTSEIPSYSLAGRDVNPKPFSTVFTTHQSINPHFSNPWQTGYNLLNGP
jgi:hypothetical protein